MILWAPGAGAPTTSPWMRGFERRLSAFGTVIPFDYPYMRAGRKRPDPQVRLIEAHRQALQNARERHGGALILAGKSMGARIGCHVALSEAVCAVICFGYPLRSTSGKLRDAVLLELSAPALFIQGTRDPLCPPGELEKLLPRMPGRKALHVVPGADHSLLVSRRALRAANLTQAEVDAEIIARIASFLQDVAGGTGARRRRRAPV